MVATASDVSQRVFWRATSEDEGVLSARVRSHEGCLQCACLEGSRHGARPVFSVTGVHFGGCLQAPPQRAAVDGWGMAEAANHLVVISA